LPPPLAAGVGTKKTQKSTTTEKEKEISST